jgi:hypothetical protein
MVEEITTTLGRVPGVKSISFSWDTPKDIRYVVGIYGDGPEDHESLRFRCVKIIQDALRRYRDQLKAEDIIFDYQVITWYYNLVTI